MDSRYDLFRVVHFVPDSNINTIPGLAFNSNLHYSSSLGTFSDAAKSPHFVHEINQQ